MHELFMSLYEISSKLSKLERQKRKMRYTMPKTAHGFQMLLGLPGIQHDQHNKASIDYSSRDKCYWNATACTCFF